ncbi:MAG: hypothetical protein OSJ27_01160 [Candidatus Gastranaerophilales bacterium]|nr:hypothetical protein [Candidatus Gastranaerophilales bacterium]
MADNLEIRVEQLTDAIRGLYNKPSLTPAEINNAFNTMLQRFENQTNLTSEKMLQIISNEIRKTAEERHGSIQEMLFGFEDTIKTATAQISNPKFDMQISKIATDLNSVYTKMNNQELQLQKFAQNIDALRTSGTAAEMVKLSNEFAAFSRGFDNITATLNKNFAEFLTQVQSFSQKEELNQIRYQLDEIIKNSQIITSAGDRIDAFSTRLNSLSTKEDTNYINEKVTILTSFLSDLKAYIEKNDLDNKEQFRLTITNIESKLNILNLGTLEEIRTDIKNLFNEVRDTATYSKDEIITKFADIVDIINRSYEEVGEKLNVETSNINNNLAQLAGEVQKVYTTVSDGITGRTEEIKMQLHNLNEDYQNLKNVLVNMSSNTNIDEVAKSIIKSNAETLELSHDFIQSQLGKIEDAIRTQEENEKQHLVNAVELLKTELSGLSDRIKAIEDGNSMKAFEEPLNKISKCVESLQSADSVKQLSNMMAGISSEVNSSITSLRENFEKAQDGTSIQVLQQLNASVPKIADKLEIFRNHVVSENSANITELKQHFAQVIETITSKVEAITSKNFGGDSVKVDLQNMSNHIMETIENINYNIEKEFNDHKTNIDELLAKISDYEDKFKDKLNSMESTFETLTQEGTDRINDAISLNQLQTHETLSSMKTDILAGIMGINKNSKTNFELLDGKLERLIVNSAPKTAVSPLNETNQQELLAEIENKVERCNLQQIHNGKELLNEIQNLNSELSFKLENLSLNGNNEVPPSLIRGIDDKIQSLLESNVDKEEYTKQMKSHVDLRMKEVIQKIAKIVSVFKPDADKEEDAQNVAASVKLDQLLSQLEYLKDNIFAEIREGFDKLDKKQEVIEDISKNVGEALSNTVYIKNNTANEFRSVLDEKLENLKNVEFLIEDLKNAIQNNQVSTLERINSFNEDLVTTRMVVNERFEALNTIKETLREELGREFRNSSDDAAQKLEVLINQASERIVSTIIDNFKDGLSAGNAEEGQISKLSDNVTGRLDDIINRIEQKADNTYSMADLEADLAKMRLSLEKSSKNIGADFQNIGGWLRNTNARLENLSKVMDVVSKKIEHTEKLGLEGITSKLVQSEKDYGAPQRVEEALAGVQKKYKIQEMRLEELDEKISLILQKQSEGFDVKSFIDLFYDNTSQTKSLASRVEGIESKLNSISKNIERIISYIDE